MKSKIKKTFLTGLLLTFFLPVYAKQQTDAQTSATPNWNKDKKVVVSEELKEKEKEKKIGWVAFPVVFYSSDTNFGFGGSAVLFKDIFKDEYINKSQSFAMVLFYTLRNQLLNANVGNIYWDNANWHWGSKLIFSKYPTDFYGIGNQTDLKQGEVFEPFSFQFENDIDYRIWGALYGGISLAQGYYKLLDADKNGLAEDYFDKNREEGFISGAGVKFSYDSRNDSFFPTKGIKGETSFLYFPSWLGSQYSFYRYQFDIRGYIPFVFNSVIALQAVFDVVDGKAPLSFLPSLGSKDLLRGYPAGRYRDNIYIAAQIEYRFPIWWRFGGVLFFGAGKVQHEMMEFFFEDLKYAGGFGVRFQLNNKKRINFRFDMGFTPEGFNFYFNLLEAF
ncbi:MAG TPA: BamA/TamA family outer membrane protein [bacterium]|nr:BamA/TamA family outer membrane protein [bacterium]